MDLVSIITPVYKCDKYIAEAIKSVQAQTYPNWELLLVDDCTPDSSPEIIREFAKDDPRIRYFRLQENSGAAVARNKALDEAKGRFITYLDADDVWLPEKIERQVAFMNENHIQFSCCDYEKIEADGTPLNKVIHMPKTITYDQLLRNTIIQIVGVIIDLDLVDRKLVVMPNVRRGQDTATWLQMLKNGVRFYGQNEVLAQYRRAPASLSANKFRAMQRTWKLFREVEKLPLLKSLWCMVGWAYHASLKRIYFKKPRGKKPDRSAA